jgi:hypothetical protein
MTKYHLALIALVVAVFSRALFFNFIAFSDDSINILEEPWRYKNLWEVAFAGMCIPITYGVWEALSWVAQEAWIYHLLNIILHALNCCIVFALARGFKLAPWSSFLVAAIFAIHPYQVEPVVWCTGLKDVLSGTCMLGGLLLFLRSKYVGYTLLFCLGILCKPTVVILPAICLVFSRKKEDFIICGLGLLCSAFCVHTLAQFHQEPIDYEFHNRFFVPFDSLGFYVSRFLLPLDVNADPNRIIMQTATFIFGIILVAITIKTRSRFMLAFIVSLLPVLGMFAYGHLSRSFVSFRYMYVPTVFLALVFVHELPKTRVKLLAMASWLVLTVLYVPAWQNTFTLHTHARSLVSTDLVKNDKVLSNLLAPVPDVMVEGYNPVYATNEELREFNKMKPNTAMILYFYYKNLGNLSLAYRFGMEADLAWSDFSDERTKRILKFQTITTEIQPYQFPQRND